MLNRALEDSALALLLSPSDNDGMCHMRVVPLSIDDTIVYVEIDDTADIASRKKGGEGRLEGAKEKLEAAAKTVDEIGATILAVCRSIHQKAYVAMGEVKPGEFEVEFGLTLGGEMGVPFVAKAQGEAQFKIKAIWGS